MRHPPNKIDNSERNLDERESVRKEQDLARLRELLLEGAESELSTEPLNAEYFERLRNRIRNRGNEVVSKK